MASIYNIGLYTATYVGGVAVIGGGVVSATPSKLIVARASTQTIIVQGLLDVASDNFWTIGAQVSGALLDEFGNQLFQIPLTFIPGSNGNFSGNFGDFNFLPRVGRGYTLVVTGLQSGVAITIPVHAEVVQAPANLGAGVLVGSTAGGSGGGGGGGGGGGVTTPANTFHRVTVNGDNAELVASGNRLLVGYAAYNTAFYQLFIKLFNKSSAPVPGVDPVQVTIGIQAGLPSSNSPNSQISFPAGIGIAVVKGVNDNDDTGVQAGDCVLDLFYV